jgi:lysophospholipase
MSQYILCAEDDLASFYTEAIQPFWENSVQQGMFAGVEKVGIAYAYVLHPKALGTVVISTGRIESFIKYKELIYDFYKNGYSVFIHDHRGQGFSGRMLENPHVGYVASFDDYVTDFKQFIDDIVLKKTHHKPNLLCHSMGGAIGALLVLRYPELFAKVAFSAPMFGFRPALPNWFSLLLLNLHAVVNAKEAYFFGQNNYVAKAFVANQLTHSEIRYQIFRKEYKTLPQVQLGGVSGHWLAAASIAMDEIEKNVHRFPIASLVIQAGADQVVDNQRQGRVVAKMPHSNLIVIDGSKHELLEEQDKYRVPCLTSIFDFFEG